MCELKRVYFDPEDVAGMYGLPNSTAILKTIHNNINLVFAEINR